MQSCHWSAVKNYFESNGFQYRGGYSFTKAECQARADLKALHIDLWNPAVQTGLGRIWHRRIPLANYRDSVEMLQAASHPVQETIDRLESEHGPAIARRGNGQPDIILLEFPRKRIFKINEIGEVVQ